MKGLRKLTAVGVAIAFAGMSTFAVAGEVSPQRAQTGVGVTAGQDDSGGVAGFLKDPKFLIGAVVVGTGIGVGLAVSGGGEEVPPAPPPPGPPPPPSTTATTTTTTTTATTTTATTTSN